MLVLTRYNLMGHMPQALKIKLEHCVLRHHIAAATLETLPSMLVKLAESTNTAD